MLCSSGQSERTPMDQAALGGDGRGRLKPQMRVVFQLGQDAGLVVDQRVGMPGHDPEQPLQGIADRVPG